jgi:predicted nucleic acid-binding protein
MTKCFVDTNVLVYAKDQTDPMKRSQAADWLAALTIAKAGVVSAQVRREFYWTASRKLKGMPVESLRKDTRDLMQWIPPELTEDRIEDAWALQDRFRLSFWDALMVASALHVRCTIFLSEDMQAGQAFGALRIVNPFTTLPEAVLGA